MVLTVLGSFVLQVCTKYLSVQHLLAVGISS